MFKFKILAILHLVGLTLNAELLVLAHLVLALTDTLDRRQIVDLNVLSILIAHLSSLA